MKKQTKNTLKVLSTLALAGTLGLTTVNQVEAKSYKPEVRYDGKDYFVKTSDPEAVGKQLYFTTDISKNQPNAKNPVAVLYDYSKYNGEELNISENLKTGSLEETFTRDTPFSIVDDEIPGIDSKDDEATKNKKVEKFVKSAQDGFTTVNKLNGNKETGSDEGKDKTPKETVKPTEKKETPTTAPAETPKATQTPTTPEKKVTDKKETPTPKATQTQEKTTDNKQVTEKKETTAKPLPKTTAETFGGLALYTFGGLSLLSVLVFFGLRKKQK